MVYRRTKVERSTFRKLAFGAVFYSALAPVPLVKVNRTQYMTVPDTGASAGATTLAVYYPGNIPLEINLPT